ncbi:MAG: hypothetical protein WCI48_02475 [Bacteroidota bacterium]|jgi:hypothetical protein
MDMNDVIKDDFLAGLIKKVPLESPSDDFVDKVMAGIETIPVPVVEKQPYFHWMRSSLPYLGAAMIVVLILISSDIPYLNFIGGKVYFSSFFLKIFQPFLNSMKTLLSSRFITYSLLIGVSAGFLFIIDKLFSRRFSA